MKLCMIGTGYVGLVSGVCFSDLGNNVICVDKDLQKINNLKNGIIPIYEPGLEELVLKNVKNKRLKFSTDLKDSIKKSDVIFICVGTPTKKGGAGADLSQIFSVAKELGKSINKFKIIITKSTVPLGTGDEVEKIIKKKVSKNKFSVVSNPEFLREGEAIRDFIFPDRVVIGSNDLRSNKVLKNLYSPLISKGAKYIHTSRRAAELIKYASNAFLATKITFINEIANLCEKTGINVDDISIGMGLDQRIGSRFLRAGPAYGGSCFPKDTKAITYTGDKFKTNLSVIKSVIKSNENRSKLLLKRVYEILNNKIKNKKICFLGVTFKANTDDMRDSSSLIMIPELSKKGATIKYFDPTGYKKEFKKFSNVYYNKSIEECVYKSDLVIIHTEWNDFKSINFKRIFKNKNTIIYDMRNLYSSTKMKKQNIKYFSVGRSV
jgi:UDPglucose 6-dehydrogenase